MDAIAIKNGSEKEFHCLYYVAIQYYRALETANNDSFDKSLTVIVNEEVDDNTRLKCVEYRVPKEFHHVQGSINS